MHYHSPGGFKKWFPLPSAFMEATWGCNLEKHIFFEIMEWNGTMLRRFLAFSKKIENELEKPPEGPQGQYGLSVNPWTTLRTPARGVCSSQGHEFCLGNLFYYYKKNLTRLNRWKFIATYIKPSWSNGYLSGLSHSRSGFDSPVRQLFFL